MKKIIFLLVSMLFLLQIPVSTREPNPAVTTVPAISIFIDGIETALESEPVIVKDRTMIPLRGVFEKLGAVVDWNKQTSQVIVKSNDAEILLEPDNAAALLNGQILFLDSAPVLTDGTTLVPVRFIAESLGCRVDWDPSARRIDISAAQDSPPPQNALPVLGSAEAFIQLLRYNHILDGYIHGHDALYDEFDAVDGASFLKREAMPGDAALNAAERTAGIADDFSGTNTQTQGVDEGDIVKTDGRHIFSLDHQNRIHIIDPDPYSPSVVSTIDIPARRGYVSELYAENDRLAVIGTGSVLYGYPAEGGFLPDFTPTYSTRNTFLLVYDISDREHPSLVRDLDFEGNYLSSRLIGEQLYLITNKSFPFRGITPYARGGINPAVKGMSDIAADFSPASPAGSADSEYNALLDAFYDYQIKPKYADNMTGKITVMEYDTIRYFPDYITPNYMLTAGIDLAGDSLDINAYLGSAEVVYASADNLYLALSRYEYATRHNSLIFTPNYDQTTSIYKFKLEDGGITYETKGSVPGSVLNQFSFDEHLGHLRVVTTTGQMWDENNISKNNLYILDAGLNQIGALTGLAPGERIYSARFSQNRIYMVTFRQVDPLFVIDAADPANPVLLGDLKIPGFSTYLHILDENHILGFGTDTDETNGRVTTGGFKISLFDVTDPSLPVEKKNEVIGVSGTYSELQHNHKALMISPQKGIMAFPITVSGKTPYSRDFSGAYVYDISNESFDFKGALSHKPDSDRPEDRAGKYDSRYSINRILYLGDFLYTISRGRMEAASLQSMEYTGGVTFASDAVDHPPLSAAAE